MQKLVMTKYSKGAQEKVKKVMDEMKAGKLRSGRQWKKSNKPQAGDCYWFIGGPEGRSESSEEEGFEIISRRSQY